MSPSSSKSKSKEKPAAKAVKEQQKASSKASATPVNSGNGVAANAYNPISGTFHALETAPSTTIATPQSNGRFRTMINETEEHPGSLLDSTAEYDSVSNNDSCSGESEDQQKDKNNAANNTSRADPVPGSDADKREKIRLKNEKKHQRQKERRAQELHERCCSYLTSRKLESLAQKLVAMGFTSEKATMALIHNEGCVEESALWLLERGEESKQQAAPNPDGVNNAKIDISDELAKIAELELNFKCTKQEVERAVVSCEGDLDKVEETLKAQRRETPLAVNQKLEESGDQPTVSANGFHNSSSRLTAVSSLNSNVRTPVKGAAPPSIQLQRRDERDFNYTKSTTIAGAVTQMETSRNLQQHLRKVQSTNKSDWIKAEAVGPFDKRWPTISTGPSTPYSLPSPLQVAAAQRKPENRYATTTNGGSEVKANLLSQGTLREPIYVMQRPQSNGTMQNVNPASVGLGSSPPSSTGWYPGGMANAVEIMKLANGGLGQKLQNMTLASRSNPQQFYPQDHHHHNQQFISSSIGGSYNMHGAPTRSSSLSSLAVPSSLGLFTSWGSSGTSPSVDWNTRGSMPQCDYTSIDWSLDLTPMALPSSSIKGERLYDNSWHASYTTPMKAASSRSVVNGLQHDGSLIVDHRQHHPAAAPSAGSPEWTNPFAGKDIFRAPRQFVTFPSP